MANPSIRGHKGQFKVFENGQLVNIVNITSVDISQDSTFQRTFYVGRPLPEGDQTIEGWSGTLEVEVKGPEEDEFIDALITNNLIGIGVSDYSMLTVEEYGDGSRKAYVYFDSQFKLSRRQSGLNEKITKTLEFQASGRTPL